jgi:hypothetical protein
MKCIVFIVLVLLLPLRTYADAGPTNVNAEAILERVLANRATKDFSLKARLFVSRDRPVPLEILVKNTPEDTRTIYRSGTTELLVVQPVHGEPQLYLRGTGRLTGGQRTGRLLQSYFSFYDLGLPFLHWPSPKFVDVERFRGRDCLVVEASASGEPYARAQMYIDKQYHALLRVVTFDGNGDIAKRFTVTSFKKLGAVWIPRAMEVAYVPPGQALPAEEKSRLEIYEGDYDTQLPAEWFVPERFGPTNGEARDGK